MAIQDSFANDLGGWDDILEGQRIILGALLPTAVRGVKDIIKELDVEESTVTDGELHELLKKDFQKLSDLCLRLIKEYYSLSGKKTTKKRLKPISEIIEGSK